MTQLALVRVDALPAAHDLSDLQLRQWRPNRYFGITEYVVLDDNAYVCTTRHLSTPDNRPASTVFWASYWERAFLPRTRYVVSDGDSVVEWVTDDDGAASPVGSAYNGARTVTDTTDTLRLTDADGVVKTTSGSGTSLTVPRYSSVPWPTMSQVTLLQFGAGQVTVVAGAGVTILTSETLLLAKQYAAGTLLYLGGDVWLLSGYLEAA